MTLRQDFETWLARRLNDKGQTTKWTQERVRARMTHDGHYGRRDWNLAHDAYIAGRTGQ